MNKNIRKILTKEFLAKRYIEHKKSISEIAKEIGCSATAILNRLKKYNIPRRPLSEAQRYKSKVNSILTKEYLIENYVNLKLTLNEIAVKVGCGSTVIYNGMNEFGIPIRHRLESRLKLSKEEYDKYAIELHKIHYCIEPDCSNKICYDTWKNGGQRCQSCAIKEMTKIPENCNGFIDGRTLKTYYCIEPDCNNIISYANWKYGSGLCLSCSSKEQLKDSKKNPNYIHGEYTKTYYCIEPDCNNEISYETWKSGSGRCRSCASIEMFKSPEVKRNLSLLRGGTGIPYENDDYPAEFLIIRPKIRKRDDNICQGKNCSMIQEEHLK